MLSSQRGDPNVVGRQGCAGSLQLLPNRRVVRGSLLDYGKHVPERTATRQPCFILMPATGGRDAEAVISQHNDRNVKLVGSSDLLHNWRNAIRKCRERIRIENHCRSSGSMFSNSASITRSILRFSLWRCFNPGGQCHPWFLSPAVAIYARNLLRQGFLDKLLERVPCRAAVAFALRKSASGISSVVFTNDCSHIYGRRQGQHRQQFSVAFASSCFVPIIRYIWAIRGWQVFCTFRVTSRRILRTTSVNRQK